MRRRPINGGMRLLLLAGALVASLLALPVASQGQAVGRQQAAEETLERAQELAEGKGVRTGRELSPALAELSAQRSSLSRSDRAEADRLLARPTNVAGDGVTAPYSPTARVLRNCSTHFCIHWVDSTNDAPPLANADSCPTPDYIDEMRRAFEQSYAVENTQLGWRTPVPDGTRGGDERTDVYVKDIGDENIYGYAAADSGQTSRSRFAFQVMDDDYAPEEFPGYATPDEPMRVTAAHEYNHILQYAYDAFADIWMFESTATWVEDRAFDAVDDWHFYMKNWAERPHQPLTYAGDGVAPSGDDLKMYSSAIWNHWIDRRYGPETVRRAWEVSQEHDGFAPGAYDRAIREDTPGRGFATDFAELSAATAEWKLPDSGIREGAGFPDVARAGLLTLGEAASFQLDHTAYRLFAVPVPPAGTPDVRLVGSLRKVGSSSVDGSIALVARSADGQVTKVLDEFDAAGDAAVTLENATAYTRITAVLVNADTDVLGFGGDDWIWTDDGANASLTATHVDGAPAGRIVDETASSPTPGAAPTAGCGVTTVERDPSIATPTPTPSATASPTATATATATPTVTPTVTPTPAPATSVRLTRNSRKLRTVARKGRLSLFARTNKAGRLIARATVDRATARRLRVGRRKTTAGTGRRTATAPARLRINVKLTRKVRAALRRHKRRSVKIRVQVTFMPADGTRAVRRTLSIRLR